jgi:hypothetical protein
LYNSTVTRSASWEFFGSSADFADFAAEEVEGFSVMFDDGVDDGVDDVMFGFGIQRWF